MKKYLLLIAVLFFSITTKVSAFTFDGDYVYTRYGTKITLEDYKLIRKATHWPDEMFSDSEDVIEYVINGYKNIYYSGKYLHKYTFYSDDSRGVLTLSKEEGIRMLKEDIKEEYPYKICLPELNLQPKTVPTTFKFDEKDSDIYTYEQPDYDKYCGLDVILKAYGESNTQNEENIEETIDENKQLNMAVISAIPTFIVIILFFIIKKWKKQKEVK